MTLRVVGELGGPTPPRLEPRWLEHPLPPSCALDLADRGPSNNVVLGEAMIRHRTLVARAVRKACSSIREHGITARDLERLVEPGKRHDEEPSLRA